MESGNTPSTSEGKKSSETTCGTASGLQEKDKLVKRLEKKIEMLREDSDATIRELVECQEQVSHPKSRTTHNEH